MSNFIKSYGNNPIRDFEINKLGMHQKLYIYMSNGAQYIYTISIGLETRWIRVQLLVYAAYVLTPYFIGVHMILDMLTYMLIFSL